MILADIIPVANDISLLYYVPNGNGVLGNLFLVNQSSTADIINVGVNTNANLQPDETSWLLYNTIIPPNHTVTLQNIALGLLQGIFVYSTNGTTSFTFAGNSY